MKLYGDGFFNFTTGVSVSVFIRRVFDLFLTYRCLVFYADLGKLAY